MEANMFNISPPTCLWSHPSGCSSLRCPHHLCTMPPPSASLQLVLSSSLCPPPFIPAAACLRDTVKQTWRGPSARCSALWWCRRSLCLPWVQHSCWALRGHRLPGDVEFGIGRGARPWGRSVWLGLVDFAHWPQLLPWCRRWFQVCCGDRENIDYI